MKLVKSLFFVGCVALLAAAVPVAPGYDVGDTVGDFKLKNVDGKMVSLSDYNDEKGVILIFDCNTCPVSRAYNERIMALNEKYASLGYPVVTINPNDPELSRGDSFEEMVRRAKDKNYDFPYLFDAGQNVTRAFGATNTPHVFVLKNENKKFKVAYVGSIDNNSRDGSAASRKYVEEAVDALLSNKPVPTPKTKAIGCGVRLKDA